MYIQFLNSETKHNISNFLLTSIDTITIFGENIPEIEDSGFNIYEYDDTLLFEANQYLAVYDSGENYVEYTSDPNTYYDYLVSDDNGYVVTIERPIMKLNNTERLYLYKSGKRKENKCFEIDLIDENDYPLYKIEDGELVETSKEERSTFSEQKANEEFIAKKMLKIEELSITCGTVIMGGMDISLSNGTKHYSFTTNDQNNIGSWYTVAVATKIDGIPYHADDEECELYTWLDIVRLYKAMQEYIVYNNTYFNMLKCMVESMNTIEDIEAVQYGMELSEEYQEKLNTILVQSQVLFEKTLNDNGISLEELGNL